MQMINHHFYSAKLLNQSSVGTRYRQTELDGGLIYRCFIKLEKCDGLQVGESKQTERNTTNTTNKTLISTHQVCMSMSRSPLSFVSSLLYR